MDTNPNSSAQGSSGMGMYPQCIYNDTWIKRYAPGPHNIAINVINLIIIAANITTTISDVIII